VLAQQETEHDKEAMRLRAQVMSVEDDAKRMRTKCKSQVHTIHSIHYTPYRCTYWRKALPILYTHHTLYSPYRCTYWRKALPPCRNRWGLGS
jgi:hypothetical protein